MAYGANTANNETRLAVGLNQFLNEEAVDLATSSSPFLYAITGYGKERVVIEAENPDSPIQFGKTYLTEGNEHEILVMGKVATVAGLADISGELAARTASYDASDAFLTIQGKLTHLVFNMDIPQSQLDRLQGSGVKRKPLIDHIYTYIARSFEESIAAGLNQSQDQSDQYIGGWQYAVDASNSYLDIDRSDSGNTMFRGTVQGTVGTLTLSAIMTNILTAGENGGNTDLCLCSKGVYAKLHGLLEGKQILQNNDKWTKFIGKHVMYGDATFALEKYAPSGYIGGLDTRFWEFAMSRKGFTSNMIDHPGIKAGKLIRTQCYFGAFNTSSRTQFKMTGITV